MNFYVDLRYFFPPLINLIFLLLTSHQGGALSVFVNASSQFDQYPILKLASVVLLLSWLLLFLLTSTKLHLSAHPITIRTGYFSCPLALSLLAAIFLPPPLFWFAYFVVIFTCPWHGMLWDLLKCFFNRIILRLKSMPPLRISCAQQQAHNAETPQPPEIFAVEFVDIEGNPMEDCPSLE